MFNDTRWKRIRQALFVTAAVSVCLVGVWFVFFHTSDISAPSVAMNCKIHFVTPTERVKRFQSTPRRTSTFSPLARPPVPNEEQDNPVLLAETFAVVRVQNPTANILSLYAFSAPLHHPDQISSDPGIETAVLVEAEVHGADGVLLPGDALNTPVRSFADPRIPPAAELLARKPKSFHLAPQEEHEFPISLLGRVLTRERGLKPGTYTVRATVSYAEAPGGETKRITSEPVTVTVTEEHIKAAEAYWAAARN